MYKCHFCGFSSDSLDDFDEDFKNQMAFGVRTVMGLTSLTIKGLLNPDTGFSLKRLLPRMI